ncbi:MAG: hypothetical protein WAM28_01915 [Chlamydiales bacterium]
MEKKFFIGTRMTPDLKSHLNHIQEAPFLQISHEGQEYLGMYLNFPSPTLREIRTVLDHFISSLEIQCPDLRVDKLSIVVFPQLFVG